MLVSSLSSGYLKDIWFRSYLKHGWKSVQEGGAECIIVCPWFAENCWFSGEASEGNFEIKMLKMENGVSIYFATKEVLVLLLFIAGFTAPVIPFWSRFILFDLHNRNKHGAMVLNGKSVFFEFSYLLEVEKSIKSVYMG